MHFKYLRKGFFALLCALLVTPAFAENHATGVWSGSVLLPTGQELPFVARLQQNGMNVSGTLDGIGGAPDVTIEEGMIHGSTVTFMGIREIQGANVRFDYVGEIIDENTIDFTIIREGDDAPPLKSLTSRIE